MPIGVVKWFDPRKGFGFLIDDQGRDVFVHYRVIEGEGFRFLENGETVQYEGATGPKGLHALQVRRLPVCGSPSTPDAPPLPPADPAAPLLDLPPLRQRPLKSQAPPESENP